MSTIGAHKTAMRRLSLSRPVSRALEDGLIAKPRTFFDYGCGRAGDVIRLHELGIPVSGWDPAYFPEEERIPADVVNLGYVVNVIEDLEERAVVLGAAWTLTKKVLIVSARLEHEMRNLEGEFQGDGIVTRKRTFQKFFRQEELRQWIDAVLVERSVAAAPGIFYVFRDPKEEQSFLASRLARREPVPKVHHAEQAFKQHAVLLQPFIAFVTEHGRLPRQTELDTLAEITDVFGSATAAFSLIRRVTGPERWEQIRQRRRLLERRHIRERDTLELELSKMMISGSPWVAAGSAGGGGDPPIFVKTLDIFSTFSRHFLALENAARPRK